MRFDLTIPDPSTMRVGKEAYVTLDAGTELHRIHPAVYKAEQFNPTAAGDARFFPIRDAEGAIIPTIYAAQTFACATCEIILRCPDTPPVDPKTGLPTFQIVYPADYRAYDHSIVRTTSALRLVDLTNAGQRRIGVNHSVLLAGPRSTYPATRGWAERIHAACPAAHGLYYSSVQYGPDFAILLFGDRVGGGILEPVSTRAVADAACHAEIRAIAESLSIDYEDV
ncbi:RES family NAD+ phosphorylase [Paracoccus pantotrophus]|uniref:RES family NAD+ phosphorylase n=1 Tax=Paracoccus pantotrophus TaxID=82367 RepID=UPI000F42A23E|nr:RES family NAD+ phosphorylase [Paracoccus pantotrophus]RNI15125.1 RES domain-containing protein [Paracoccus pantotrophus]